MKFFLSIIPWIIISLFFISCKKEQQLLDHILSSHPEHFKEVVDNQSKFKPQIIYTKIDRDEKGKPKFSRFEWGEATSEYFYPASTVKLPTAILALQKLNELQIEDLNIHSEMITDSLYSWQTSTRNKQKLSNREISIATYIDQIFAFSDNQAYNRLYEFCTSDYIRKELERRDYKETTIVHRLSIGLSAEENRVSNPISFYKNGEKIYEQSEYKSSIHLPKENIQLGKGYLKNGELVDDTFDFTGKNHFSLSDQHEFLKNLLFPNNSEEKSFKLNELDYQYLLKSMASYPREISAELLNDQIEYTDNYVKFLMFGNSNSAKQIPASIRIFNKSGVAYGFLIDNAYVVDFENNIEFLLSAVIYVNENEIFNDDNYQYDKIGLPFLTQLGQKIYEYELKRERQHSPDLSKLAALFTD